MKKVREDTKDLFAPFFKLKIFLNGCNDRYNTDDKKYKELVDECMSSFYGTSKLSVNRPMQHNSGILCFIYGIDKDKLFEAFISQFSKRITAQRRNNLIRWCCLGLGQDCTLSEFGEIERVARIIYEAEHLQNTLIVVRNVCQELTLKSKRIESILEFENFLEGKILRAKIKTENLKKNLARL